MNENNSLTINDIQSYDECVCGAVTIRMTDGRIIYCHRERLPKYAGISYDELKENAPVVLPNMYMCNHCVNHYGIDLCGCGSGEEVGECDDDWEECRKKIPKQTLDGKIVKAGDSWV